MQQSNDQQPSQQQQAQTPEEAPRAPQGPAIAPPPRPFTDWASI